MHTFALLLPVLCMHTQRIAQCAPAPSCNFPPARLHWLHVPRLGHGEEQINQLPRSLTGHYCITRGCPGDLLCPVSPMSPGTRSIVLGRGGSFLCPERRTGAELGLVTGEPGGIKRSRVTEHHPGGGVSSCHRVHHLPDFAYIKCILQSISPDKLLYCLLWIMSYLLSFVSSSHFFLLITGYHGTVKKKHIMEEWKRHTSLLPIVRVRKHILIR